MPKVSIIIPFNNVESYIDECLKSVLNQTLKDIEVILINDASTDKSRNIAASYAKNDKRIKILNVKERKGQGFARNRGIEIANGEYIGFVDSDDFIEPDMFELLYNAAKKDDTDITMCQVREYDDINENYITSDYYSLAYLSSFGESVFSAQDTKNQILDINVALWNKIYKREYLINLGEKFPEGFIYEDLPFFFGTYLPAQRINIVWKNLYSYRVNRKNSTMQQFNNKILDRLPMVSLTYEKLKQVPYLADLKQKIQGWIINDLFHRYTLLKENFHREYFFLMKKVFESLDIENIEDSYWSKVYHFQGYLLVINNNFEEFNQKVFNEYIDIHKVEDRLRSEMININEVDRRFALLYEDLNKTYKYTENLVGTETDKITEKVENYRSEIVQQKAEILQEADAKDSVIIQQADEKIANVYDEITKNYKYTEDLAAKEANKREDLNQKIENVRSEIVQQKAEILQEADIKNLTASQQTDEKLSKVYDEITKNYDYTNSLAEQASANTDIKIDELKQNITENYNNLSGLTDDKISKVYDEITKNYDYTDTLSEKTNTEINNKIENIKSNIDIFNSELIQNKNYILASLEEKINFLTNQTDLKISQTLEEIAKNCKYTEDLISELENQQNEKNNNLYNDMKDLSFVVQNNFVELNKEQNCIKEKNEEIIKEIKFSIQKNQEQITEFQNEYEELINSKFQAAMNILKQADDKINNYISNIQKEAAAEREKNEKNLADLKSEFKAVLDLQNQNHDDEMLSLRMRILETEDYIREEIKSPLKKIIEKFRNNFVRGGELQKWRK